MKLLIRGEPIGDPPDPHSMNGVGGGCTCDLEETMEQFWMVWVAGRAAPKILHASYEEAVTEAERLRRDVTGREVFVLAPVHRIEGRKLLTLKGASGGKYGTVEKH